MPQVPVQPLVTSAEKSMRQVIQKRGGVLQGADPVFGERNFPGAGADNECVGCVALE